MNKFTLLGVPISRLCVIVTLILMSSSNAFAQAETYTTIRKNINPLAHDLNHNLSDTQDSLILENKFLFKKVRFLNETTEKIFDFKPAVKRAKIPLDELPVGDYTVMFYQADKIIVFKIDRLLPFDYRAPLESVLADANLEEDTVDDMKDDVASISSGINLDLDSVNTKFVNKIDNTALASNEEIVTVTYNLSEKDRSKVQTRAEYRRTNLRPNGKPYD